MTAARRALLPLALLAALPAGAQDSLELDAVEVSGGVYEVLRAADVAEGGFELHGRAVPLPHLPRFVPALVPMAGLMATGDGALYAYAGFGLDFALTERFTVTPSWAFGAYDEGEGRDLGGVVEFRSALDLAYRLGERAAIGLSFYHLSNAGLYDLNPGSESLVLTWRVGR
ncbi:MAG TPA: acyloxyacyl hydrolase [Thermoanaerobaculia bacterium]|nr:acyloxyacyl hydrolase [Thermoanaerobaculia bacterium]